MISASSDSFSNTPHKIISLVPSITELLFDLELEDKVAGITKFCVHPQSMFQTKEKIGGTKNINIEKIISLQPDLIIASKEENIKDQVETLAESIPVLLTDVYDFDSALKMIEDIGTITGSSPSAMKIISKIQSDFSAISLTPSKKAIYLIWKSPYMTVGGDTYISAMMQKAGCSNVFQQQKRYPEITLQEIQDSGCDYILLSSEPYPFCEKHVEELQANFPEKKVLMVDGEMFSWYGSRMTKAAGYFSELSERLMLF